MSVPAVYLPEAEDDVVAAHASYENRQTGLGDRFLEAAQDQVNHIRSNPQLYGIVRGDIRAAPLHGFPMPCTTGTEGMTYSSLRCSTGGEVLVRGEGGPDSQPGHRCNHFSDNADTQRL